MANTTQSDEQPKSVEERVRDIDLANFRRFYRDMRDFGPCISHMSTGIINDTTGEQFGGPKSFLKQIARINPYYG